MGHPIPLTLWVMDRINKRPINILHNFLQGRVAKQSFKFWWVMEKIQCITLCLQVYLFLGPYKKKLDLFVL